MKRKQLAVWLYRIFMSVWSGQTFHSVYLINFHKFHGVDMMGLWSFSTRRRNCHVEVVLGMYLSTWLVLLQRRYYDMVWHTFDFVMQSTSFFHLISYQHVKYSWHPSGETNISWFATKLFMLCKVSKVPWDLILKNIAHFLPVSHCGESERTMWHSILDLFKIFCFPYRAGRV